MKKLLICLFCVVLLVSVTACGDEPGTDLPGTPDTPASTTTEGDATTPTDKGDATTPTSQKESTTSGTKKPTGTQNSQPEDNVVDWDKFFGEDTTKPDGTTSNTKKPTTTSTTKPTTTTTKKPTTIDKVTLPAVGTDVDGKGRIAVSKVELDKGVLTLKIRNNTDKQTQKWITEETNYVTYACYDKDGKELKGKDDMFGYFYIGCLEVGEETEFKVTLPAGTAEVKLTGSKIVYWTPWS